MMQKEIEAAIIKSVMGIVEQSMLSTSLKLKHDME
jgi:hypothetical protein